MNFEIEPFGELRYKKLYDTPKLRSRIFIAEQSYTYNNLDRLKKQTFHQLIENEGKVIMFLQLSNLAFRFPV